MSDLADRVSGPAAPAGTKSADAWIDELAKGKDRAFPNIKRADVVDGLRARVTKPSRIDQANTSLCGPASLFYCVAQTKAALYARYVTELYQTGKSTIGTTVVKPGTDCRKYAPSVKAGIHPVDWIALASLRDSENDAFSYASPSAETGGITMPGDLLGWFIDAGFAKQGNYTNLVFTKDVANLKAAGERYKQRQSVCLFISANMLETPGVKSTFPDHWVVLASNITFAGNVAAFTVFSWGELKAVELDVTKLCRNLYGYIASSAT
jgi:hypothetical protein